MATLRELIIKISANSQSFQSEISRASRLGRDYYRTMQDGGRQAAAASRESERALQELTSSFSMAGKAAAAAGAAFATGKIIQIADEWNAVNARLKQASQNTDDFAISQRELMLVSQRTGTAFADNANLFARSAASMREFGYSSSEVLKITEAVSTGLKLSGANTQEASSVITQFSQALAQGVLRGEEFNAVNESGDRVIRALAAGMGVARKDLKAMADAGKLTIDKVVPALISQLGTLKGEFEAMPQTVSSSLQRVTNSFMAWVGGVNEATGATDALSGGINGLAGKLDSLTSSAVSGALDDVADNMTAITTAAGALIGVGLARYLGGIVTSASSSTTALISAAKAEVNLAAAQDRVAQSAVSASRAAIYRAQQELQRSKSAISLAAQEEKVSAAQNKVTLAQTRLTAALASGTATEKVRAKTALDRAQSALVAARNTDAQALAEKRLAAAQAAHARNTASRVAAQANLNNITSVGTRLMSSALGLVGGIPGVVMLGAGAWYAMYQSQERARESALNYAGTIDQVRASLEKMSVTQIGANIGQANISLTEQTREIEDQEEKVARLSRQHAAAQATVEAAKNGLMVYTDVTARASQLASELAIAEGELETMMSKRKDTQSFINDLTQQSVNKMAEMSGAVSSLADMYERLNTVTRQTTLLSTPKFPGMALPQLDDKQQTAIARQQRNLVLSSLKGTDKARQQAMYEADDLNLPSGWRERFINDSLSTFNNNEKNKPDKRNGKGDADKTVEAYKRLTEQQREQIALSGQATELAKIKYQVAQGELSTLNHAQKTELMRNALALDSIKSVEKFKSLQEELLSPEDALLQKTRERIELLKQAAPVTNVYREVMEKISKQSVQSAPEFSGVDASVGGPSGELIKVAEAHKELEKWHKTQVDMQKKLLDEKVINEQTYADRIADINKANNSKMSDIQAAYGQSSLAIFSDMTSQTSQLLQGMGKEGSAAYRTLFLASKAAAIAQSIVSTEVAATKALELGPILGIPASVAIRATGYASTALIAGQTLAGMAHDGIDRVPETGTWLLQKGERVVTASTSAKLDATLERVQQLKQEQGNHGPITVNYHLSGKPDDVMLQALDAHGKRLAKQIKDEMTSNVINPQSPFGRALHGNYRRVNPK